MTSAESFEALSAWVDPYEDYDPYEYDESEVVFDAAYSDLEHMWSERTGEPRLASSTPLEALCSAAALLAEGYDVVGDEDGASFVWKMEPSEALAHVRPRIAATVRPLTPSSTRCPARSLRPPARSRERRSPRRTARTVGSRGDPSEPDLSPAHVALKVAA